MTAELGQQRVNGGRDDMDDQGKDYQAMNQEAACDANHSERVEVAFQELREAALQELREAEKAAALERELANAKYRAREARIEDAKQLGAETVAFIGQLTGVLNLSSAAALGMVYLSTRLAIAHCQDLPPMVLKLNQ